MDVKIFAGIAILAIIVAVEAFALIGGHSQSSVLINASAGNLQTTGNATSNQTGINSSKVLFASTQYAPYAYQIYPKPITPQAQSALAGFSLNSTALQNGTSKIIIGLIGTNQQQYMALKPNYKLYIIETTFGDDGFHFDSSLGDDGFVAVDPNGYVV